MSLKNTLKLNFNFLSTLAFAIIERWWSSYVQIIYHLKYAFKNVLELPLKKTHKLNFNFVSSCNNTTIVGQVSYSNDLWFKGHIQKSIVLRLIKFHFQLIYDSQDVFKNVLYPVWSSFIFKWLMIHRLYSKIYCTLCATHIVIAYEVDRII